MMEKLVIGLMILFALLLVAVLIVCGVMEGREWDNYRQQHGCQLTGQKKEDWFFMPISNGAGGTTMMLVDDTKHEWRCDTGTIWR